MSLIYRPASRSYGENADFLLQFNISWVDCAKDSIAIPMIVKWAMRLKILLRLVFTANFTES